VANEEHVRRLKQGVQVWNAWRRKSKVKPNISGADLSAVNLERVNFSNVNLKGAKLVEARLFNADLYCANAADANLMHAELRHADLSRANLTDAVLANVDFSYARLAEANLQGARLAFALFIDADMYHANLTKARLQSTIFVGTDLGSVLGLETCEHVIDSVLDHRTIQMSGALPLSFLRGVGLPDIWIDYLPSLINEAIQRYSCFISYSTKDQDFVERLFDDLQNRGVRCWFASHDMPIGGKIRDEIDVSIRLHDKVLLILSEHSIASDWVEEEVTKALEEEHKREPKQTVLFPIRLDDAVMETKEAWASMLRARHIGDFRQWKSHDAYTKSFERVLRDLTVRKTDGKP
jgi:hypothetical protein